MASAACPSCGASAVIDESGDGISQVCTACGVVVDSAALCVAQGINSEGLSYVPSAETATLSMVRTKSKRGTHYHCHLSSNRLRCNDWIKKEGAKFGMDPVMREQACNFFNKHVGQMPLTQQLAFAAACCYQVLRDSNQSVLLHTLTSSAQCSSTHLCQALRMVRETTGVEVGHARVEELLPEVAQSLEAKERKEVISRATALLKPLRLCWFLEGRSPHCVAPALIFTAWKSLDISTRVRTSYPAFCQRHSLPNTKPDCRTVCGLNKVLIQLAAQIPWLKGKKLSKKNASVYVPDVIRYAASLAIDGTKEADDSSDQQTATDVSVAIFRTFRKGRKGPSVPLQQDTDSPSKDSEDGDADISDSEIDNYIRTEREVRAVEKFLESHK
uniref:BRF2-like C-terminal domain-containing protein n=1 Tax=Amblyomma maculatum TaxID=34609 RepID=G3ML04_AMBMU